MLCIEVFETEAASYPIESVTFRIGVFRRHPEFTNSGLVEDEGTKIVR